MSSLYKYWRDIISGVLPAVCEYLTRLRSCMLVSGIRCQECCFTDPYFCLSPTVLTVSSTVSQLCLTCFRRLESWFDKDSRFMWGSSCSRAHFWSWVLQNGLLEIASVTKLHFDLPCMRSEDKHTSVVYIRTSQPHKCMCLIDVIIAMCKYAALCVYSPVYECYDGNREWACPAPSWLGGALLHCHKCWLH